MLSFHAKNTFIHGHYLCSNLLCLYLKYFWNLKACIQYFSDTNWIYFSMYHYFAQAI